MDEIKASCPFLGLVDDPSTRTSFPSYQNVCHKARPQDAPNLRYQQDYCLGKNHVHCSFFWLMKKKPLPKNIRAPRGQFGRKRSFYWKTIPLLILLTALAFAGFTLIANNQAGSTSDQSATETRIIELMASAEAVKWTHTPTPTVYLTETPNRLEFTMTAFVMQQLSATPSPTATNTPKPAAPIAPQIQPKKPKKPQPTSIPIPP